MSIFRKNKDMYSAKLAQTPDDIMLCWDVVFQLRPHLVKEQFVETIQRMQQSGFQLAFIEQDGKAVVAAGFEIGEKLHRGKYLYIDDLTTLKGYQKLGLATAMLNYIHQLAIQHGCKQICLDSGTKPERYDAHRLYLNEGFNITSFHFVKELV